MYYLIDEGLRLYKYFEGKMSAIFATGMSWKFPTNAQNILAKDLERAFSKNS